MNKHILKVLKIVTIGIFALNMVSCSDFLDKNPLDQISSEAFWTTEKDADMALAGVYSRLYSYPFRHKDTEWDIMAGDVDGNQSHAIVNIARGQIEPTSGGIVSGIYTACYQGIGSCNFFLANIDKAPLSTDKLNRYKAEVQFLRALFYFTLVDAYGGVPLYTAPVTIDEAKVAKSTKEQVVQQVISDLDFAIANLPNNAYADGHAVKGSALALKARVLLYDSKWNEAATAANQIITDGKFSLYNDFRKLFLASGKSNNPEIIFSTRHRAPDVTTDVDVRWAWHGVVNPRKELVDAYECTDGLPITSSPLYNPGNWRLNRDPRLLLTIKAFEDSVVNSAGKTMGFQYNAVSGTGFNPVKYCNWDVLPIDYSTISEQDWIILRFADVLLMYAEAQNEAVGPDASVYTAVNRVRARVNMPALPAGLTKDQMRVRIRNERRVELALEGVRWGDIKRWKTAETYIPTLVDPGGARRVFVAPKHYLLPFPQSERDINPNLEQNSGY
jgi:starch-binding outer membrane protein, SusD/RagB family